jgi:hypothetical protein
LDLSESFIAGFLTARCIVFSNT